MVDAVLGLIGTLLYPLFSIIFVVLSLMQNVFYSFAEYRERRAQSRRLFWDEKKQHKFLKALEKLTIRKENAEEVVISPLEMMVDYGSTISKEFAKSYMVKKKIAHIPPLSPSIPSIKLIMFVHPIINNIVIG